MKSPRIFLIPLLVFIFLLGLFFYRVEINTLLQEARYFVSGFWDGSFNYQAFQDLKLENQKLKARPGKTEEQLLTKDRFSYRVGRVYSRYPFNDQRFVIIDIGSQDTIVSGMPVLSGEGILLGKIESAGRTQSIVRTIFDPGWRSSVVIGPESSKALLKGGMPPSLDLISREASVRSGDYVFNVSPDFPFNLVMGIVSVVKPVPNDVWLTARLDVAYQLENIDTVLVVTDFP